MQNSYLGPWISGSLCLSNSSSEWISLGQAASASVKNIPTTFFGPSIAYLGRSKQTWYMIRKCPFVLFIPPSGIWKVELSIIHYVGQRSVAIIIFCVWAKLLFQRYYQQKKTLFILAYWAQKTNTVWAKALFLFQISISNLRALIEGDWSQTWIEFEGPRLMNSSGGKWRILPREEFSTGRVCIKRAKTVMFGKHVWPMKLMVIFYNDQFLSRPADVLVSVCSPLWLRVHIPVWQEKPIDCHHLFMRPDFQLTFLH